MKKVVLITLLPILLASCYSNKRIVYLQDSDLAEYTPKFYDSNINSYQLQINDVLSIVVKSLDQVSAELFNMTQQNNNFGNINGGFTFLTGFSIDREGNIKLPIVGMVKVAGLTIEEAEDLIQTEIDQYLVNSTVVVKMVSFDISVLGEVRNPGYFTIFNGQANVLEGLSLAGDLIPTASRKDVKLIRQTPDGTEIQLLDLTDPALITSNYFYLQPNDVIYVEPLRARISRENLAVLGPIFSIVSTVVLVLNYLDNN
jgi:polysaccharide export outer membrane protein